MLLRELADEKRVPNKPVTKCTDGQRDADAGGPEGHQRHLWGESRGPGWHWLSERDEQGRAARPWLTAILDDHSRAVAGYTVFLGSPTAVCWTPWPVPRTPSKCLLTLRTHGGGSAPN